MLIILLTEQVFFMDSISTVYFIVLNQLNGFLNSYKAINYQSLFPVTLLDIPVYSVSPPSNFTQKLMTSLVIALALGFHVTAYPKRGVKREYPRRFLLHPKHCCFPKAGFNFCRIFRAYPIHSDILCAL